MENLKFKTNIKCGACVATVTPKLNDVAGAGNWQVDVQNPEKILTVSGNNNISEEEVIKAVEDAGYRAEHMG